MMNPYLNAGGGYLAPPASYFGASRGSGVWTPSPQSYFGAQCPPHPGAVAPPRCPPSAADPCMRSPQETARIAQLQGLLRHPLGQWPAMPNLDPNDEAMAAALVVAAAQRHSDDLVTIYGVDSGSVLIPAAAAATITVTPQKRHIPEKLVMSTAVAAAFLITGIFAGVEPVLATTGPISAAIFVQDSTSAAFKSVIMDVGMDFSVGVTNISGADARFTTTVVGKPVPPGL